MSIPLDQLYHYIEHVAKEITDNIVIYRFYPYGSKNIEDLEELVGPISWEDQTLKIPLYCNDQEPLNYSLYQNAIVTTKDFDNLLRSLSLNKNRNLDIKPSIYDNALLLHSEQRSKNLIKYQNNQFIPVYYWSHAVISLDWYRYAQHITQRKSIRKKFLIYNRAWSGTREYRLKFTDLLINLNLVNDCHSSINAIEPDLGIHYTQHTFSNSKWKPSCVLENYFPNNTAHSHSSAEFDIHDYESTDIEMVLETLFDDDRLHLTEKSLRPIALGQPFIIAGTYGSLEYLRNYGFKTFDHLWDESYDLEKNPSKRLHKIVEVMKQISQWDLKTKTEKMRQAQSIADYNKKHFFSDAFFCQIKSELNHNLQTAIIQIDKINNINSFIEYWEGLLSIEEITTFLENDKPGQHPGIPTTKQVNNVLKIAKQR